LRSSAKTAAGGETLRGKSRICARPRRETNSSSEVPIPYPHHLEEAALPQPAAIVAAAKAILGG